jgi:hypothetical protein
MQRRWFLRSVAVCATSASTARKPVSRRPRTDLLDSSSERVKVPDEEGTGQDAGRRQQGVVDLVQVTVDGLAVRVGGNNLGVEVELERRRKGLLLEVDSQGLTVVGAKLRVEGGADEGIGECQYIEAFGVDRWSNVDSRNGLVVSQLGSTQSLG